MKKYFFVCLAIFWLVAVGTTSAQEIDAKVTSIFLYNFTKYIKWPVATESGDFIIGIVGESPVEAELQKLTTKVKVGGTRNIVLRKVPGDNAAAMQGCHILYVAKKVNKNLKDISAALGTAPVLLVTEGMGLANKGSVISLYIDEESDKLKVELSKKALEKSQLRASSDLLALAVVL
jgi:hypothetical protein